MKIEEAREHQKQLALKWESRVEELTKVITKYPWNKMEYDFGDWRESEIKGRTQQIAESNLIIEVLEKQIPKEVISNNGLNEARCPKCDSVFGYSLELDEYTGEKFDYCYGCGQALKWGE